MSDVIEHKRCAILGTAPSWTQCPWDDKGLHIFGLNDAWVLGYKRVDAWFDLHPFNHFVFYDKQRPPDPLSIPHGVYFRPKGHLEWLKQAKIPVLLQQADPAYPTSQTFPKEKVLDFWAHYWPWRVDRKGQATQGHDYEVSTPAWMLMFAVLEGYREIHIYGIHLSTEWEYLRQRPNMEFLIGVASGMGIKIVLPERAPICKAPFQYAYHEKPEVAQEPTQRAIDVLKAEQGWLRARIGKASWRQRAQVRDWTLRLQQVELELSDAHMTLQQLRQQVA